MWTASTCCTAAATSRRSRRAKKPSSARRKSSTARSGSRPFPTGLDPASVVPHSKRGIRRCPIKKEAHLGTGDDENRQQAVHLPHQEVGMAVEGNGEDRGRPAGGDVPHPR